MSTDQRKLAQHYGFMTRFLNPSQLGRMTTEYLYEDYSAVMDKLREYDQRLRDIALGNNSAYVPIKQLLEQAEKSYVDFKYIDALSYLMYIDDVILDLKKSSIPILKSLTESGLEFAQRGDESSSKSIQQQMSGRNINVSTDQQKQAQILRWLHRVIFGHPLQRAYAKQMRLLTTKIGALINAAKNAVTSILEVFTQMGYARSGGNIDTWMSAVAKIDTILTRYDTVLQNALLSDDISTFVKLYVKLQQENTSAVKDNKQLAQRVVNYTGASQASDDELGDIIQQIEKLQQPTSEDVPSQEATPSQEAAPSTKYIGPNKQEESPAETEYFGPKNPSTEVTPTGELPTQMPKTINMEDEEEEIEPTLMSPIDRSLFVHINSDNSVEEFDEQALTNALQDTEAKISQIDPTQDVEVPIVVNNKPVGSVKFPEGQVSFDKMYITMSHNVEQKEDKLVLKDQTSVFSVPNIPAQMIPVIGNNPKMLGPATGETFILSEEDKKEVMKDKQPVTMVVYRSFDAKGQQTNKNLSKSVLKEVERLVSNQMQQSAIVVKFKDFYSAVVSLRAQGYYIANVVGYVPDRGDGKPTITPAPEIQNHAQAIETALSKPGQKIEVDTIGEEVSTSPESISISDLGGPEPEKTPDSIQEITEEPEATPAKPNKRKPLPKTEDEPLRLNEFDLEPNVDISNVVDAPSGELTPEVGTNYRPKDAKQKVVLVDVNNAMAKAGNYPEYKSSTASRIAVQYYKENYFPQFNDTKFTVVSPKGAAAALRNQIDTVVYVDPKVAEMAIQYGKEGGALEQQRENELQQKLTGVLNAGESDITRISTPRTELNEDDMRLYVGVGNKEIPVNQEDLYNLLVNVYEQYPTKKDDTIPLMIGDLHVGNLEGHSHMPDSVNLSNIYGKDRAGAIRQFPTLSSKQSIESIIDGLSSIYSGKKAYYKYVIKKEGHKSFSTSLKKAAKHGNPYLLASMMLNYSDAIEDLDPNMSIYLLSTAKGIIDGR